MLSALLALIALIVFALAAFGATFGNMVPVEMVALGLVFLAGAFVTRPEVLPWRRP